MDSREHPRFPIRLAVRYPSARSLLGDYTKSISKGGVAIDSERELAVGQEFVFEMSSPELPAPLEVHGKVVWTRAAAQPGKFMIGIQYTFPDDDHRERLERVIGTILAEHAWERQRKHPRVPVSLEMHGAGRIWMVRDLAQGGLNVQSVTLDPIAARPGQRFHLDVRVADFDRGLEAEVVWVGQPYQVGQEVMPGRLGAQFIEPTPEQAKLIDDLMRAKVTPQRIGIQFRPMTKRGLD